MMKVTSAKLRAEGYGCLILMGLFTWLILMGGTTARAGTESSLLVSPAFHDFGAVKRLGGEVHTSFMVHVQGDTPIKIRRIWTS
jgi:hypothetical protein